MDSTQKILKEMSDMTRNLDVLVREIREMNKLNSINQKTVVKNLEEKATKAEKSAEKSEKLIADFSDPDKKQKEENKSSLEKELKKFIETRDKMFEKAIKSINKNHKTENENFQRASLNTLQNTKTGKIETELNKETSLESKNEKQEENTNALLKMEKPQLKERESAPIEPPSPEKTESSPAKINQVKEEKSEKSKIKDDLKIAMERSVVGKSISSVKSLFKKEEAKKDESTISSPDQISKKEVENKIPAVDKKEDTPGFFEKMFSKLNSKSKSIEPENKTISSVSATSEIKSEAKEDQSKLARKELSQNNKTESTPAKSSEGPKVKSDLDINSISKSDSSVKSLTTKKSLEESPQSVVKYEIRNETPVLKSPSPPVPSDASKKESTSEISQGSKETATRQINEQRINIENEKSSPSVIKEKLAEKKSGKEALTSKDLSEIKSLLSAINMTLKGPLSIRDNKPLRPRSNPLE